MLFKIDSRFTPGWTLVTSSSRDTGWGRRMHRSVITAAGPFPGSPADSLELPPLRKPTDVTKSSFSTNVRFVYLTMINTSFAEELISGAPPAPGRRTFGFLYEPTTVVLIFANRSN